MFVHRLPWVVLAGMLAGLVCGNVQAARSEGGASLPETRQVQSVVEHTDYYLAKVPGTDRMRKVYYFARLDRNHNGQLERSELPVDMHKLRREFIQADWNRNGQLSPMEYIMWARGIVPQYTPEHGLVYVYRYGKPSMP